MQSRPPVEPIQDEPSTPVIDLDEINIDNSNPDKADKELDLYSDILEKLNLTEEAAENAKRENEELRIKLEEKELALAKMQKENVDVLKSVEDHENLKSQLDETVKEIEQIHQEDQEKQEIINQLRNDLSVQAAEAQQDQAVLKQQLDREIATKNIQTSLNEHLRNQLKSAKEKRFALQKVLKHLNKTLEHKDHENNLLAKDLDREQREHKKTKESVLKKNDELVGLAFELDILKENLAAEQQAHKDMSDQLELTNEWLKHFQNESDALRDQWEKTYKEADELRAQLEKAHNDADELSAQLATANNDIAKLQYTVDLLKEHKTYAVAAKIGMFGEKTAVPQNNSQTSVVEMQRKL